MVPGKLFHQANYFMAAHFRSLKMKSSPSSTRSGSVPLCASIPLIILRESLTDSFFAFSQKAFSRKKAEKEIELLTEIFGNAQSIKP